MVRRRKTLTNVKDAASLSVVRTLVPSLGNQMYSFDSFNMADYARAAGVAQYYQRYRIRNIKVTWKPVFDSYVSGGVYQKPNLYFIVDKTGSLPDTVTLEALKQSGARPRAFDEKPISVNWAPSVLMDNLGASGGAVASGFKISPLLSTNSNPTTATWAPSTVAHGGIKWYMETPGTVQTIQLEVELQFEFFRPMSTSLSTSPARGIEYARPDSSPDGVEGGSDGI